MDRALALRRNVVMVLLALGIVEKRSDKLANKLAVQRLQMLFALSLLVDDQDMVLLRRFLRCLLRDMATSHFKQRIGG